MKKLGNLFTDDEAGRHVVGSLVSDGKHSMVKLDVPVVVNLCRASETRRIVCACIPFDNIGEPPYVHGDLQLCKTHDKRVKLGWLYTESEQKGSMYLCVLERDEILKAFDKAWLHVHTGEEEDDGDTKSGE